MQLPIFDVYSPPVKHDRTERKSYLFIRDRWVEIGDIQFHYEKTGNNTADIYMSLPCPRTYAESHPEEGAEDWLLWGPRLN